METILAILRNLMVEEKIDYLLVNSTNKFLVEYNSLNENSRYHLTGFTGSTGDALLSMDKVFLFVDGRYHIQADLEVNKNFIIVVKLQTGQNFLTEMLKEIPKDATLGIFSQKVSQITVENIQKKVKTKLLLSDPLDAIVTKKTTHFINLSDKFTGLSDKEKIKNLGLQENEALLLSNLEDVSYLFNIRDFSKPFSASAKAKAIVMKNKALLFEENKLNEFEQFIKNLDKEILVDKSTISAYDYALIRDKAKILPHNPIKQMKSIKTNAEIEAYKDAFQKTDNALLTVRTYIEENNNLSEANIAKYLELSFKSQGAKILSFNSIIAKDKNSALAHYSKSSPDEIIEDGSLILIDCGAYFESGLATDITRVFVKGKPTKLQRQVYTTVLKAFLHAYNTKITEKISGYDIDTSVHKFFNQNPIDGFVFNHGLGHGIGISVHEAPPNLSQGEIAKIQLKENMCFTIEPGLYNSEFFGVRLENSCHIESNKIKSFVHMPFEDKLIDYDLMDTTEQEWLKEFGVI